MSIDVNVQNDLVIVTESSEDITVNVSNAPGPAGVGVPVGGTTGQVLKKQSGTDYDTYWALDGGGVPYSGATGDVDLGEFGLSAGYLQVDTTPTNTPTDQGTMYWDDNAETIALVMNGTIQKVGEDLFYHVTNQSGSSIPKGTAVRFAGTDGNSGKLLIAPFIANGSLPSFYYMGITSETIANGDSGKVYEFGKMRGINTSAYNDGDILYASTSVAGGFQTTAPVAPNNIIVVAAVVNAANNGTLMIRSTISDAGANIYNSNGTLTANRTLTHGGYNLTFAGGTFSNRFTSAGRLLLGTSDEGTFLLDVNGSARIEDSSNRYLKVNETGTEFFAIGAGSTKYISANAGSQGVQISSFGQNIANGVTTFSYFGSTGTWQDKPFNIVTDYFVVNGGASTRTLFNIAPTGSIGNNHTAWYLHRIDLSGISSNPLPDVTFAYSNTDGHNAFNTTGGSTLIGTTTQVASSIFTIASTTKGVLLPRLTSTQRTAISSPATGLFLYDTTLNSLNVYNGTSWVALGSGGGGGITGSGAAGQVSYWDGTSSQAGSNNLFWDNANGRLGIGTSTPAVNLDILGTGGIGNAYMRVTRTNNSTGDAYFITQPQGTLSSSNKSWNYGLGFGSNMFKFLAFDGLTPTTYFGIFNNGNVLIQNGGTFTDSGQRLQVQGTTLLNGNVGVGGSVTPVTGYNIVNINGSNGGSLNFSLGGTRAALIYNDSLFFTINTDNSTLPLRLNGNYLDFSTTINLASKMRLTNAGRLLLGTTSEGAFIFDAVGSARITGNMNMNATASAWGSNFRVIEMQGGGTVSSFITDPSIQLLSNLYHDGSALRRITAAVGTRYFQGSGEHNFEVTGSGAIGSSATMTTAMKLTNAGRLLLGTTTETATELTISGSETASSAIARGGLLNTTLVASANNDVLVGLDIAPTFTNGAFTGVTNYGLRINGNQLNNNVSATKDVIYAESNGTTRIQISSTASGASFNTGFGLIQGTSRKWSIASYGTNADFVFYNDATATNSLFISGTTNNVSINSTTDAGFRLDVNGTARVSGDFTIADTRNIILATGTGTKIGTTTSQKLSFWNATPIVQPTTAVASATRVGGGGTALTDTDTFDGYTLSQIVKALRNAGLLA
jgi:hypothetical protein